MTAYVAKHKLCFCRGSAIPRPPAWDKLSRVLLARDLQHNIRTHRFLAEVPRRTIKLWENGLSPGQVRGLASGPLGYAWVTKKSELDSALGGLPMDARPKRAVDALGLAHRLRGGQLVIMEYPASPAALELRKPTFIDGCDNFAYCSTSKASAWGRARCLTGTMDACSEAVHRAIEFTSDFTIQYLGVLRAYAIAIDHKALLRASPHPWRRQMRRSFLRLLA